MCIRDRLESHFAAIEDVQRTIDRSILTQGQLTNWMQTINALRLVIGTVLDVDESREMVDLSELDPEAPETGLTVLYHVLSELLFHIVAALSAGLPPPTATGPELSDRRSWRAGDANPAAAPDQPASLQELFDLGEIPDVPDTPEGLV